MDMIASNGLSDQKIMEEDKKDIDTSRNLFYLEQLFPCTLNNTQKKELNSSLKFSQVVQQVNYSASCVFIIYWTVTTRIHPLCTERTEVTQLSSFTPVALKLHPL